MEQIGEAIRSYADRYLGWVSMPMIMWTDIISGVPSPGMDQEYQGMVTHERYRNHIGLCIHCGRV